MELLHGIILISLVAMAIVTAVNIVGFPSLRPGRSRQTPTISVLIPARNEENNIERVLDLLARQDYPDYEVIVLDDQSEDRTPLLVRQRMESQPHLSLIEGKPLPEGWVGKSHACAQLASAARGSILLFMDADTQPSSQAISAGLSELERTQADLLTVIPRQCVESFWERVLIPILHFSTFSYLPMPLVPVTRTPSLAMANGQYMLFRREAYEAVGGHDSVRSALVEDVWLARRIKAAGRRLEIRYGGQTVRCRMYGSMKEIWAGFSKNIFPGLDYSVTMLAVVGLLTIVSSILPFGLLAAVLTGAGGTFASLVFTEVGLILGIRAAQALRFDMDLWSVMLHPLAMLIFLAIAVNSCLWTLRGSGARWKNRAYKLKNPSVTP